MSNIYESRARSRKARRIAAVLRQVGATDGDTARLLDPSGRRKAETLAGTREGSARTWELVAVLLDAWSKDDA